MIIGKKFRFEAAHSLPEHPTCGRLHGHTWYVTVELVTPEDLILENGMAIDFQELDAEVRDLIALLDHTYLNHSLGDYQPPTCERVGEFLKHHLRPLFEPRGFQVRVKVQEGDGGYVWL